MAQRSTCGRVIELRRRLRGAAAARRQHVADRPLGVGYVARAVCRASWRSLDHPQSPRPSLKLFRQFLTAHSGWSGGATRFEPGWSLRTGPCRDRHSASPRTGRKQRYTRCAAREQTVGILRSFVLVVAPAAQDDILERGWPSRGIGHHVMELQTSAFCAPPGGSDKRALPTIAHPDLPPDRRWNVAGSWCDAAARLRSSGRGPFGLLEVYTSIVRARSKITAGSPVEGRGATGSERVAASYGSPRSP